MLSRPFVAACAHLLLLSVPASAAADDLFRILSFESRGRSVAAELADLDGDGRTDLFVIVLEGIPPEEQRTIRVYLQKPDGELPATPDYELAMPGLSAVYDVADVRPETPGEELILLQPEGVTILSLGNAQGRQWQLSAPGPTSVGLSVDERGLEPFRLVYRDFGPEPWILVPQFGQLTALSPGGEVRARLELPRRANYFLIPTTGLLSLESDFQIFVDVPKISIGDVDGDGQVDVVSSTRHELRVFLRRSDGSFPNQADRQLPLRMMTPRDQIRGSGGVSSELRDIDGDGRLDLLITHVRGGFSDAITTSYLYLNREGQWRLGRPDQALTSQASLASAAVIDIDGNRRGELLRVELSFSLLEVVELLLTQSVDVHVAVHRFDPEKGAFEGSPWLRRKLGLPFSFQTFRLRGFVPTARVDLNADGFLDLVTSGGGEAFEVFTGGGNVPFGRRDGQQKMSTAGMIHFRDLDGDGLADFVLFDPHNFDVPVRVGRNRGALPGTPERLRRAD